MTMLPETGPRPTRRAETQPPRAPPVDRADPAGWSGTGHRPPRAVSRRKCPFCGTRGGHLEAYPGVLRCRDCNWLFPRRDR